MLHPVYNRLPDLIELALEYCALVDSADLISASELLTRASVLLPRLHASVAILPGGRDELSLRPGVDLETRFNLFSKMRRKLGRWDAYWMEFDHCAVGGGGAEPAFQHQSGSLADDITDIYFDLKRGLELVNGADPIALHRATNDLSCTFRRHWGEHLVDAERHVFELLREGEID